MKQATLENMPKELRDAYVAVAPHPEQLRTFHDKCANRMREFKDWRPEDIQSIKAPTLLMVGDADSVRPEHAIEMFRLLPHAQLAVFPGGHGAYIGEVTAARLDDLQVRFDTTTSATRASKIPDMVVTMIEEFLDAPGPKPILKKSSM
jgi:pimeloyl-ACP methyl ester carboxylesterase